MKKKLKFMEKVAITWTAPIAFVVFLFLSVVTVLVVTLVAFLNVSGTFGAFIYLFEQTKLKIIDLKLKKLIREDEKKYKFDSSNLNYNEDTTTTTA